MPKTLTEKFVKQAIIKWLFRNGWGKVQLQGFLEAVVHNVKRMIMVNCSPLMVSEDQTMRCALSNT